MYYPRTMLCLLLLLAGSLPAEPVFRVGFVVPSEQDDPFFSEVVEAMRAAAEDLNIELMIDYSGRGMPAYARKRGLKLMETHKPDYFLTGLWPGAAKYHLPGAEARGIKSFIFNAPVIADADFSVIMPREELPHWLGQMTPDNHRASYLLADILIGEARKRRLQGDDGKVRLIALSGGDADITAEHRVEGLKARINQHKDAVLQEVVLAGWQKNTAERETERLLELYPGTSVIWAASDHMAQGAAEAAERAGRKPGTDIMIGGFDWNEENLHDIESGRLTVSIGGHILEGAWALVLLYDYHKGIDFADELNVKFNSEMYAITAENIGQYRRLGDGMNWGKVDFRLFSKALNPDLKRYDFSLPMLFKALAGDGSPVAVSPTP